MAKYTSYKANTINEFAEILDGLETEQKVFEIVHIEKWEHAGKNGYEFIIKELHTWQNLKSTT